MAAFIFAGCTSTENRRTTGEYFDDQAVNARVKTALLQDDDVAGMDVSTTTYDGVVQLSGFADDAEQRERAEELAKEVPGVETVVNNITVNPRAPQYGSPGEVEEPAIEPAPESEARP